MDKITIPKIRPVAWRIYVSGRDEAEYVRRILRDSNVKATEPREEPMATGTSLYAVDLTYGGNGPFTMEELAAILEQDERIDLEIEAVGD